jgi:hypothetical protein
MFVRVMFFTYLLTVLVVVWVQTGRLQLVTAEHCQAVLILKSVLWIDIEIQ